VICTVGGSVFARALPTLHVGDFRLCARLFDPCLQADTNAICSAAPCARPNAPRSASTTLSAMVEPVVLDRGQQVCYDDYLEGKNVCIVASAGCGKSVVLRRIIGHARTRYGPGGVAVCSWYGAAADLIGGQTLHSLFRCGVRLLSTADMVSATKRNGVVSKLNGLRLLVVDEVFTISAPWLVVFLAALRGVAPAGLQQHPAGGVQVICTLCGWLLIFLCPVVMDVPPVRFYNNQ